MCQNVTPVERSRLIIWSSEVCCNRWVFQIESGMSLVWTLLWVCRWLPASLTRFGWLWIDSLNLLTSYPWTPTTTSRSMLKSILHVCYVCMEFQRWSSRVPVCCSLLGATARIPRDSIDSQFSLSPADGWSNRESQPNSIRCAENLSDGISG
jgi:hypothetical protein